MKNKIILLLFIGILSINKSFGGSVLKFKNTSSTDLWVAISYNKSDTWITEGWWKLYPGQLKTVLTNITNKNVYWYAKSGSRDHQGNYYDIVDNKNKFKYYSTKCNSSSSNCVGFNHLVVDANTIFTFSIGKSNCKGNCDNGYGTYYYKDGDRYTGNWEDGYMHGSGTYYYKCGSKYDGERKKGKKHGYGIDYCSCGSTYKGYYKDGKKQGRGTMYFSNGGKYVGDWYNNKRKGKGTLYFKDGDKYVGSFKDNNFHGLGSFYYSSGDKYTGEWKDDKKHGNGVYTYASGNEKKGIWYKGNWKYHCNLHLILVTNTYDVKFASNGKKIKSYYENIYRKIAEEGKMKLKLEDFSDRNFNYSKVKEFINEFKCNENDVIVFHYFGHGGRLAYTDNEWPVMQLSNNVNADLQDVGISLAEIKDKLYLKTSARLGLFFADCCNAPPGEQEDCKITKSMGSLSRSKSFSKRAIESLFVNKKGSIIASSSKKNQFAFPDLDGTSLYTVAFDTAFENELIQSYPDWYDIMKLIKDEVYDMTKNCHFYTKQIPQSEIKIYELD